MTFRLLFILCLGLSIPIWFGYTYLPADLLSLSLPWKAGVAAEGFQNHFYLDAMGEQYPWKVFLSKQLQGGALPLWNPYNYCGTPFLSLSAPQIFDPFNLFYLFLKPQLAFDITLIFKIFFAGLFISWLLSFYGVRGIANTIGALAYALNGAFIADLHMGWTIGAFVWVPLVFLFLERGIQKQGLKEVALSSLFLGFAFNAGNIQVSLYILLLIFLWVIFHGYQQRSVSFLPRVALSLFLGLLIYSVSLTPTLEMLSFGFSRVGQFNLDIWLNHLGNYFARIPFIISFLVPHFFGHYKIYSPVSLAGAQWHDFIRGYVGLVPLFLALFGLMAGKDLVVKKYKFLAFAILGLLFLTPLIVWFYYRALVLWCFAVSILAALGVARLTHEAHKYHLVRLKKMVGWFFVSLVVGLWIVYLFIQLSQHELISFWLKEVQERLSSPYVSLNNFYLGKVVKTFAYYSFNNPHLLLTMALVGAFYFSLRGYLRKHWSPKKFQLSLLFLTLLDLIYFAYTYVPIVSLKKHPLYPTTGAVHFLQGDPSYARAMALVRGHIDDPIFYHESNIVPGIPMVHHTGSINYLPAQRFAQALYSPTDGLPFNQELANLVNVKYFVTKSIKLDTKDYPLVYKGEVNIYENPSALPRLFFPKEVKIAPYDEIFSKFSNGSSDLTNTAWLEESPPHLPPFQGRGFKKASIQKYQPNEVALNVALEQDQMVVLTDTHYPGWKAFVDGKETPIYRANANFRAIYVPSGKHKLLFQFSPLSFWVGSGLSAFGILSVLLMVFQPFGFLKRREG